MAFPIQDPADDPRRLSQAVLQITEILGLYQAELARILGLQCGDVGRLASGRWCLEPGSEVWDRALLLLDFYQRLYDRCGGESVAMVHWLRVPQPGMAGTPHQLMVDEGRLGEVVAWFDS